MAFFMIEFAYKNAKNASTGYIYLSLLFLFYYFLNIPNLIYLLLKMINFFMYCWNAPTYYCIIEKCISMSFYH